MTMEVVRIERHAPMPQTREERRWWVLEGAALANAVAGVWAQSRKTSTRRLDERRHWWALYGDDTQDREDGGTLRRLTSSNMCHSTVQTCLAHIAKSRPRPLFATQDGDDELQRKAKDLTTFSDGMLDQMRIGELGQLVFRDAAIEGTGLLYIQADRDAGEITAERVPTDEVEVPLHQGSNPRWMVRRKLEDRDDLIARYPEAEEDILARPAANPRDLNDDRIEVLYAWHLPTRRVRWLDEEGAEIPERRKGAKAKTDGRHVVVIGDVVLHSMPWTWPRFPILPLRWEPPTDTRGWWGVGLVELIAGKQEELDDLSKDVQTGHRLGGKPMMFLFDGSQVDGDAISNEFFCQVKVKGPQAPQTVMMPTVNPAVYQERQRLQQEIYDESGVSHANATGQKPAGVTSGVAIREVNDLGGTRWVIKAQTYEQYFLDITRMGLDLARWLYDEHEVDLTVKGDAGKFIRRILWSKVDMQDDMFRMKAFPASLLPTTPGARMQTITDMMEGGLLSPEEGRHLLQVPDLEGARGMTANDEAWEYAVWVAGEIVAGRTVEIDPRCNLDVLLDRLVANYLRALRPESTVTPAVRERMREAMDTVMRWQSLRKAGATPRQMLAGEMPPPPEPPPAPPGPAPMGPVPMGPDGQPMGPPSGPPIPPELMAPTAA